MMPAERKSARILDELRAAPEGLTRNELADRLSFTPKKTSQLLTYLRKMKLAEIGGRIDIPGGRPRARWRLVVGKTPVPAGGPGVQKPSNGRGKAAPAAHGAEDPAMWQAVMREAAALGCAVTYWEDEHGAFGYEMAPCAETPAGLAGEPMKGGED